MAWPPPGAHVDRPEVLLSHVQVGVRVRRFMHPLLTTVHEASGMRLLIRGGHIMGRRNLFSTRRRSSGADALVGVLVVAAIAIAALGIYLVIIGAVALVAWLAQAVIRQTQARSTRPRLVAASATTSAPPPPEQQFHEAHPVDRSVFDDPVMAEAAAVKVFSAWASRIPRAPKDAGDAVRGLELRTRLIGRLTSHVEGRRVVARSSPFSGREKVGAAPISPASIDPWNPPVDLRQRSRHVASCWGCHGEGRTACVPCGGAGRTECRGCDGAGKIHGTTANGAWRLLNCKECKGRGDVVCAGCSRGKVGCGLCHKMKKLEVWLEVDASRREDVQVEPDGEVTRAYRWGQDGVAATREEIERDARVICEISRAGAIVSADLPDAVPDRWTAAHWQTLQPTFNAGERIQSQTFALLEVPAVDVTYAIGQATQTIELQGLRMLAPPIATDTLFQRRATSLRRIGFVLMAIPIGLGIFYLTRGDYFRSGAVLGVVAAAATLSAFMYAAMWYATIGRRAARRWLWASIAPGVAAAALAIVAEPSARAARAHVSAGDVEQARAELDALGSRERQRELWADVELHDALAEADPDRALEQAAEVPRGTPQAIKAAAHVDQLLLGAARASLRSRDATSARARLASLSPAARDGEEARTLLASIHLSEGEACLAKESWPCALERAQKAAGLGQARDADELRREVVAKLRSRAEKTLADIPATKDLEARVALQASAEELWSQYLALEPGPEPVPLITARARNQRDVKLLAQQREIRRKKQEADERRAAALQAKEEKRRLAAEAREQRRQEAAERRAERRSRSLLCNDGTTSPSCSCGGSWRGCCSHHGGVAGCE